MAFTFPQGLAPELYPLAWLVGKWQGEGMLEYPGIPSSGFVQNVTFDHDGGPYLRYESTIYLTPGEQPEVPDPMAQFEELDRAQSGAGAAGAVAGDAGTGAEADGAGSGVAAGTAAGEAGAELGAQATATNEPVFWSTETGYWRIAPEPHEGAPADHASLEVLLSDPAGRVSVYLGIAGNGKVQLVSDLIARTATAVEVSASKRMYGNVNGDLMWVHSLAAFGQPMQDYVSATLKRIED